MSSFWREQGEDFLTALGFFTRLPTPWWLTWSPARLARGLGWLPLIGTLVGGLCALVYLLAASVLPVWPAVLLSMAAGVLLTGAFHEDGFADSCDGLGGGWEKQQVLEIMKDSRMGSYGVIGLVLLLLTKAASLVALADDGGAAGVVVALLVAHPLSRLAAVAVAHWLPYAREDDRSKIVTLAEPLSRPAQLLALAGGLLPLLLLTPLTAAATLTAALLVMLASLWLYRRRLGGYTGDLLGATQQLAELSIYLALLLRW